MLAASMQEQPRSFVAIAMFHWCIIDDNSRNIRCVGKSLTMIEMWEERLDIAKT